ncbi:hypothetical protein MASR1M45_08780 [Candidatus Kapaibacterium sp.]
MKTIIIFILFVIGLITNACNESTVNPTIEGSSRFELLTSTTWIFKESSSFEPQALMIKFSKDMWVESYDNSSKKMMSKYELKNNDTFINILDEESEESIEIVTLTANQLVLKIMELDKVALQTFEPVYTHKNFVSNIILEGAISKIATDLNLQDYLPVLIWAHPTDKSGYIAAVGTLNSDIFRIEVNGVPVESYQGEEGTFKAGLGKVMFIHKSKATIGVHSTEVLEEFIKGGVKNHSLIYYNETDSDKSNFKSVFQLNQGLNLCLTIPSLNDWAAWLPIKNQQLLMVVSDNPADYK